MKIVTYVIDKKLIQKDYVEIYYRNMKITWILQAIERNDFAILSDKIIKKTKTVICYKGQKIIICKNKKDLETVYSILKEWYFSTRHQYINIAALSLKNYTSDKYLWCD